VIKLLIIDRDGTITHGSKDPASPFYYILDQDNLILKPDVTLAFKLLGTLRRTTGLKVVMATKQRCISKGLITWSQAKIINWALEDKIGFTFDGIYMEDTAETKRKLFEQILADNPDISRDECYLIDDSVEERNAAWEVGIGPRPTNWPNLEISIYNQVRSLFRIT
jgi:histidinol phosphatase-like enzyme